MTSPRAIFVIPGDLESLTGGYGYDRRVIGELRARGWSVDVVALDDSFPHPTPDAHLHARRVLAACADNAAVVIDGLAFGAMAEEAERERDRLRLIALVHHPLAHESGLDPADAERLFASEKRALACARLVVVTSPRTAGTLASFDVPADRIAVVEPGTDRAPLARGSHDGIVRLVTVASVTPRKGYDLLVDALAALPPASWQLTCVGSLERDPECAGQLRAAIDRHGLADRISFAGELAGHALAEQYERADVFVLPTRYEGYGMVVGEALARGLPVVSTRTGAIADLVGSDAGILIEPDDSAALVEALERVIGDPELRRRLTDGARRVRSQLPTWSIAGELMAAALSRGFTTVGGFSAAWLDRREPADVRARSRALAERVAGGLPQDRALHVLDLGAGTGSNVRFWSPILPLRTEWLLADHDVQLLEHARERMGARIVTRQIDLARLSDVLEIFADRDLVTASALLDLVSAAWVRTMLEACARVKAGVLFALSYDGRIEYEPAEPEDSFVRDLVNRHQRGDKGFGPALGPSATDVAARELERLGYRVWRERTDWVLKSDEPELQRDLIDGWANAAIELAPHDRERIESWRGRRLAHVSGGTSRLVVGHEDLAALPGTTS